MEDWKKLYQQRLMTTDEAVKLIKSGDRVATTHATAESELLSACLLYTSRCV